MPESNPNQEFFSQLNKAQRLLIALPTNLTVDVAGAATALYLFVKKLKKEAELVAAENFPETFAFLPRVADFKSSLVASRSLGVVVDTSQKILAEVSYVQQTGKTKIFLKSGGEEFSPKDISFEAENQTPYDLAIILGAQSLEDLGPVFENNPDVFYETPKVNIDIHPGNKYFGQLNLVELSAVSLAESVARLLAEFETDLFDEDIATALLSGIIAKTKSFQHPQVSPKSFLTASELVAKGARQQEIIRALFKAKPLPLLKLWGRSLVRLQKENGLAVAGLTVADFIKSEADLKLLPLVLIELFEHLDNFQILAVLAENGADLKMILAARLGGDLGELIKIFGPAKEHKDLLGSPAFTAWEFDLAKITLPEAEVKLKHAAKTLFQPAAF